MLDFTKRKQSSPLRQTLLTGGAISLALILAIMAVESYAQEPNPTGEPPVETVQPEVITQDDAPAATPMPVEGTPENMMPETAMPESVISDPMTNETDDSIVPDCPPDTVANEDGTCLLVEDETDQMDDTEIEIDPERVERTLGDEP